MLGLGLPPARPGVALDLTGLDRVIDHAARDLTITVEAGIRLSVLAELLARENQWLPIDVPHSERATLGGALATNASGPRRLAYGTLRDYVIGITVVNEEGKETRAGGRVVKNVAGYDLCKLHIGALGTLGIITQATLKVRPRPESRAMLALGCSPVVLDLLLDLLHGCRTRPVCIESLNAAAARYLAHDLHLDLPETAWVTLVGFEDHAETARWQVDHLESAVTSCVAHRDITRSRLDPEERIWRALTDFPLRSDATLSVKANLLPRALPSFRQRLSTLPEPTVLRIHAGNGIVHAHFFGGLTLDRARTLVEKLRALAAAGQGNVIVTHCPPEWKRSLPVWGVPRDDGWLMTRIKQQLDPNDVFNPGRFLPPS
jgi:glycolate oxidase FAD binding subunit